MAKGYIILKHQVFDEITDEEVLAFLPKDAGVPVYKIFNIKREIISMDKVHLLNNVEFRIYQKNLIDNEIKPYINENPDHKVLYFGKATIPLALHLGYCFGSWKDVDVYLFHREQMNWDWRNDDDTPQLPTTVNFVSETFKAPIDVIYKVEVTYLMQDSDIQEVVDGASKIISLTLDQPGKDVFRSQEQLKAFAHQFSLGLDSVANYLPDTDKIHLFPTVPVGLAFLMGTKINPLLSKPIVTYQFDANKTPKNEQVLILQEVPQAEVNMTDEDIKLINEIKADFKAELENKIAPFAQNKVQEKERQTEKFSWVRQLLPDGDYSEMEKGLWRAMPDLAQTIIKSSTLSLDTDKAGDGFHISEEDEWQISDRFIFNMMNRLDRDKAKIARALRLFVFHEGLHIHQNLTNATANNIGRFPRVLEEADYVADVWAMLHEFAYSQSQYNQETKNAKDFFRQLIDVATKTMWAFDDLDPNTDEMQVRRVNRYLIWYWNYIQIEDRSCTTLQHIVNILANKPIIEIRGLDIRAQAQRTIFRLTGFKAEELEIGYLQLSGKILRASNSGGFQLNELVNGYKERDGEKILETIKGIIPTQSLSMFRATSDIQNHGQASEWLNKIGEALDLTSAQYKAVEERYTAVANYLSSESSSLKIYKPEIKPQGSFLLGTMIKPIMQDDELDIDLVCRLSGKQQAWAQYHLKQAVGDQLKANEMYKRMLDEEGNRCWTLLYAESTKFHMDILPAIVGQDHYLLMERKFSALEHRQVDQLAIKITDKRLPNHKTEVRPEFWPKSNPFGYAGWFNERAALATTKMMSLRESVESLPAHVAKKEPLKRIVQILKRHRDMMYGGDDDKPISIIITTLAAKAYQKEENIVLALLNILDRMDSFIEPRYSAIHERIIKWVSNPVNDVENFADKWPDEPIKEENFYAWLYKAKEDFSVLASGDLAQIAHVLKAVIGTSVIDETIRSIGINGLFSESRVIKNFDRNILSVSHREKMRWPENLIYKTEIQGSYKQGKTYHTILADTTIPKGCDIYFVANTDVPRPFDVYWQVVNTGQEANQSGGLRGGIYPSRTLGVGGLNQKEHSLYRGDHWIECFIVKNNVCVARSREFMVSIA